MKIKNIKKPVVESDGIESKENLPYPIVLYPGTYGSIFAFKKKENSPIVICSCARIAIENYIAFRLTEKIEQNSQIERMFILDSMDFPISLVRELLSKKIPSDKKVLSHLKFENKICHECNNIIPKYRHCSESYGSIFKQTYGWYIYKQALEFGVLPITFRLLKEVCPQEILDFFEMSIEEYFVARENKTLSLSEISQLEKTYAKQIRKVWKIIENEVRIKFSFKKIGEAWTSETVLYHLVCSLFSDKKTIRHFRPDYLDKLELDIYIPSLNLGIEYQGIQHFKEIRHWGGKQALIKTQERDNRKKQLCALNNIYLIYFYYSEELSEELVREKLKQYLE